MTLTDTTLPNQTEFLSLEFNLRHPPKKVWRALTDPELIVKWLLPAINLRVEPGAQFTFHAPPQPGWDGTVNCQYLEIEPCSRLTWKWVVGEIDTLVTITLTPTESGTRLLLVQSGFKPSQRQNFAGARYGWKLMSQKLIELLTQDFTE